MIIGTGIDLVSIEQTDRLIQRFGDRFLKKAFTDAEISRGKSRPVPVQEFAAWFAAKESVMKALGAGIYAGVKFKDIEVIAAEGKRPRIKLRGKAKIRAAKLSGQKIFLSLSHEKDYAAASAIIEHPGGAG